LKKFNKLISIVVALSILSAFSLVFYAAPIETESKIAFVIELNSGIVLYDKSADLKAFPASTTKIMTALIAMENAALTDSIIFSDEAVREITKDSNVSHIAMEAGEVITLEQALYGMLVPSANEVCNGIAETLAGSVPSFVEMMNERAVELGAKNTHFSNTNGLHEENHYTTAYDLAMIMKECIKHDIFQTITTTRQYQIEKSATTNKDRIFNNTNSMVEAGNIHYNEYILSGKTGYTAAAGYTIVIYAKKGDLELIIVTMNGDKNSNYNDVNALLGYYFENTKITTVTDVKEFGEVIPIKNSSDLCIAVPSKSFSLLVDSADIDKCLIHKEDLPEIIDRPYKTGEVIGKIDFTYNNILVGSVDMISMYDVDITDVPINNDDNKEQVKEKEKENGPFAVFVMILLIIVSVVILTFVSGFTYMFIARSRRIKRRRARMSSGARVQKTPKTNNSRKK